MGWLHVTKLGVRKILCFSTDHPVEHSIDLPSERDLEECENEEPEEAVDEEEDEEFDDEVSLVRLGRPVVLEACQRLGDPVPDNPVEQLKEDSPARRVCEVERHVEDEAHLHALDRVVAAIE